MRQLPHYVLPPSLSTFSFMLLCLSVMSFTASFYVLLQVHSSVNGENFKSRMHAEHIELLHSPWLIELGAFYLNSSGLDGCELDGVYGHFSCDLNITEAVMTLILPDSIKLEYNLTCAICLVRSHSCATLGKKKKLLYISVSLINAWIVI